ncbi:FAD-dependent oxidoreductase domain-containing protein 1 [Anastrepha ludens]|uniref:FAD-dependent oxidoreductase domain-containing protein 1 n=1 Tax=Anastrepha ludens TaxID=28586 RepID=UPI0023AF1D48|nr:FAD-dependent oxidoreductase domain-containing protein 1 [Anastrepha ludens]
MYQQNFTNIVDVSMMSKCAHILGINLRFSFRTDVCRSLSKFSTAYKSRQDFCGKRSMSVQTHRKCNVVVIGGGAVGASTAFWLKKRGNKDLSVIVLERDPTYKEASTVLSVGGVRQQFSLSENIQMSIYGAEFIENSAKYFGDVDLCFRPHGYLVLASEQCADILRQNSELQKELGARNELLTASQLTKKFPWINADDVALGCHGLEKEGWFDPWALLGGFRNRAKDYGAGFLHGEVLNFDIPNGSDKLNSVNVRAKNNDICTVDFDICVLAAGARSGEIARQANIGTGAGDLSIPLPVEPRKRFVYVFTTQGDNAPGPGTPLTIDLDGTYFRRDGMGSNYITGRSPSNQQFEPPTNSLDVDHEFFETDIWPTLAKRCSAFESIKVCGSWAGYYEYNTFDENGIVGPHTYYKNLYIATGFSGHGIQQSPAVGRAISELILDGRFKSIDLSRLGFDRIAANRRMCESNIY